VLAQNGMGTLAGKRVVAVNFSRKPYQRADGTWAKAPNADLWITDPKTHVDEPSLVVEIGSVVKIGATTFTVSEIEFPEDDYPYLILLRHRATGPPPRGLEWDTRHDTIYESQLIHDRPRPLAKVEVEVHVLDEPQAYVLPDGSQRVGPVARMRIGAPGGDGGDESVLVGVGSHVTVGGKPYRVTEVEGGWERWVAVRLIE